MFGRLYVGELKKIFRPKAMIVLSVVLLVLLLLYAIVFRFASDLVSGLSGDMLEGIVDTEETPAFNELAVSGMIDDLEEQIAGMEKAYKEERGGVFLYPSIFSMKAQLTAYRFVRDNQLYDEPVRILGINYDIETVNDLTADNFVSEYMAVVAAVVTIYGIVVGAGLLSDEYKNGTIKLLMTRPIGKGQLVSAKLLAALTVSLGIASLFTFIGYVYGLIAFPSIATKSIYLVFNAKTVIRSTVGGYLFGVFFMNMFRIATMCLIAYFLGTIIKKKSAGIIIAVLIYLACSASLPKMLPVVGLLLPDMCMMDYFMPTTTVAVYGDFFLSTALNLLYVALVAFGLYCTVYKRDVI